MNIERWAERIYNERDFSRNVATSVAGLLGLLIYLYLDDWVVAAFAAMIAFPVTKIVAGALHSRHVQRKSQEGGLEEARQLFERLSSEEKQVLFEFVRLGGSVMPWSHANKVGLHEPAVSSLMQRKALFATMTADGMREAFGITVEVFDVAKEAYEAIDF